TPREDGNLQGNLFVPYEIVTSIQSNRVLRSQKLVCAADRVVVGRIRLPQPPI
ncbi:hypothetical protein A2U01_0110634, partial [Trifolium medium]|nr:hypothetical protein [Trifolium medium]